VTVGGDKGAICSVEVGSCVAHGAALAARAHQPVHERAELLVVDGEARRAHDDQICEGALWIGRERRN
jgi:hypothetical protein